MFMRKPRARSLGRQSSGYVGAFAEAERHIWIVGQMHNDPVCVPPTDGAERTLPVQNGGSRSSFGHGPYPLFGLKAVGLGCRIGRCTCSAWPPSPPGGAAPWCRLPGGARDVRGNVIRSVPVQAAAGPVVPHHGSRISMGGSLLHVAQRDPGIERGGNKRVPQRVRRDGLADSGAARGLTDDPPGAVPVQPPPVSGQEDRPLGTL